MPFDLVGEVQAASPVPPVLPPFLRDDLGGRLRAGYAAFVAEPQPRALLDLVARLEDALARAEAPRDSFRDELLAAMPALRLFAMTLAADAHQAEDLVQETLLRGWQHQQRFQAGTCLRAWLFTILRNQFYTTCRKRRREVEDADGSAAQRLAVPADQDDGVALRETWEQVGRLPAHQREALLLTALQGLSYEAAARVMGCRVGTAKSRVNRARIALTEALGGEPAPP
ncbi:RNA polymerase, sigma-24 subunit, ECF subfamily [Methylobacterium sp. 4-46]|uniref:sigma-70 family RNA polymerase sigma factor n=1 Tax=unclassified Methylobacterium TaxID=2615210 RepID=UPI000152CD8A|nr:MULTISPECIES: sigma-70 family RNA polymerase sigma factor [Methylobacterium]ACA19028.1 RNA polymerase, sigma-24 subunit, ECF subfamily [Methylobacterium sp. 4-46]WFT78242.1 sigma-70 family RNA polymerase sigma factor [Methylobacterium nodulans]